MSTRIILAVVSSVVIISLKAILTILAVVLLIPIILIIVVIVVSVVVSVSVISVGIHLVIWIVISPQVIWVEFAVTSASATSVAVISAPCVEFVAAIPIIIVTPSFWFAVGGELSVRARSLESRFLCLAHRVARDVILLLRKNLIVARPMSLHGKRKLFEFSIDVSSVSNSVWLFRTPKIIFQEPRGSPFRVLFFSHVLGTRGAEKM